MFGPYTSSIDASALPNPLKTRDEYALLSYSNGKKFSSKSTSNAEVKTPPFTAVAAIERASISATEAIWLSDGLLPSLLSKFLVVCRMLKPLLHGTSPAPKHGPQKHGFTTAPLSIKDATEPFLTSARFVGCDPG